MGIRIQNQRASILAVVLCHFCVSVKRQTALYSTDYLSHYTLHTIFHQVDIPLLRSINIRRTVNPSHENQESEEQEKQKEVRGEQEKRDERDEQEKQKEGLVGKEEQEEDSNRFKQELSGTGRALHQLSLLQTALSLPLAPSCLSSLLCGLLKATTCGSSCGLSHVAM